MTGWFTLHADHLTVDVRLTPGALRDAIDKVVMLDDGRPVLAVRVRAVAEKGKANTALATFLAKALKRPKSACRLVAGATSRRKVLRVDGEPTLLAERLVALAGEPDE